jgi:DNA gyrase subunit A
MLALVNNAPKVLNLKEILEHYLNHRFEVVTRRTKFDLDKAEKRAHLLEGFRIALENIDSVIEKIRACKDGNEAREALIERWSFSDSQARAILDMKLQRLTGLEREKIDNEYAEITKLVAELNAILENPDRVYEVIKEEVTDIRDKYGDKRRTQIEEDKNDINIEDLIKDEKVIVTLTSREWLLLNIKLKKEVEKEFLRKIL